MERHRCKICSKCFPCGRSLGGHMRSHMRFCSSLTEKEKLERSSYGLRENPKKTFKLSDFAGEDPTSSSASPKTKQCRVCGREFPSWKALFGHMRCHSNKICRRSFEAEEGEEDQEEEASWKQWWKLDSSVTEQEEVAISLMMLSRDVSGCWSITAESSDLEFSGEVSAKQKILTLGEFGKKRAWNDGKGNDLNGCEPKLGIEEIKLESRYQCSSCNRSFHSYQALGGHRASHKRIRGCCFHNPNADFDEHRRTAEEMENPHSGLSKKSRIHECTVCGKIFASGQALGGHKRSHLVPNADAGSCSDKTAVVVVATATAAAAEVPELLDLNLPAPVDEESGNVKSWWFGASIEPEHNMMNLLTN